MDFDPKRNANFFSFFNIEFRFISQQEAPRESSIAAAVGATTVLLGQVWEYGPPPDRSCMRTKKVKNKCIQKIPSKKETNPKSIPLNSIITAQIFFLEKN